MQDRDTPGLPRLAGFRKARLTRPGVAHAVAENLVRAIQRPLVIESTGLDCPHARPLPFLLLWRAQEGGL